MQATLWNRIAGARVVALTPVPDGVRVGVQLPDLLASAAPAGRLELTLGGVSTLFYLPYDASPDDPEVEDPVAIVAAAPVIQRARVADDGRDVLLHGPRGFLRLGYRSVHLADAEGFERACLAAWETWRRAWNPRGQAPALVDAVLGPWTPRLIEELRAAWAATRTSALAEVLGIVDDAIAMPGEPASAQAMAHWDPTELTGARVRALGRAADGTWAMLERDRGDGGRRAATRWAELTRAVGRLGPLPPDPRVGRGLETVLQGPPEHLFGPDRAAHLVAVAPDPVQERCADVLFPLLLTHGDAGSAARLADRAGYARWDADCYGVELAERLSDIAAKLRDRYPTDATLPWQLGAALRNRR